jgi:molecular chaperone GrpE
MEEEKEQQQNNGNEDTDDSVNMESGESEDVESEESENTESEVDEVKLRMETEIKQAGEKISELEKQLNEYKDAYLRKAAEFENFKRRNESEISSILKYAAEPFIKNILSVYDDLERSLNHIGDENNIDSLTKGLEFVFEKFTKILDSQGVKKIDAKGKPFDVELHEALMQQPAEGVPPHTVLEVIEQGYIYKDKVLRHAKVIVSADSISTPDEHQNESSDNIDKTSDENR